MAIHPPLCDVTPDVEVIRASEDVLQTEVSASSSHINSTAERVFRSPVGYEQLDHEIACSCVPRSSARNDGGSGDSISIVTA